ncbi:hypothetical protein ACQ4PT_056291 [Festuca glaucescens]
MELLFELLLTAAATLLVAVLLAKLFAAANADQPRHDRAGAAVGPVDLIAVEEERIDEVKVERAPAPALSEGWVEVEKAPAATEGKKAAWVAVEEGVPAALAPELFLGTVLEERKEEGEVGKMPRDLTAAATEAAGKDLCVEAAAPKEILEVQMEKETVQQRDFAAEVVRIEVIDAESQKQQVHPTEAVEVKQSHLVDEAASTAEVIDAGMEEEEGAQAAQVIPHELASHTVPDAVLDVVLEKQQQQEEQVTQVDQHELAAQVAPREIPDEVARELAAEVAAREMPDEVARELAAEVAPREMPDEVARELAAEVAAKEIPGEASREEELKEQSVEEVVHQHEEVQIKEEAQCEASPVDQPEKQVPKEESAVPKADNLNVRQEGSSNDNAAVQLPEKEATLLETPEDEDKANMEFEEWEGIERSEVEKRFGAAAAFAASDAGVAALSKLDSDVQLQLQGLLKVAVDGPCYASAQPLTLRSSSRAKWVSWQKLGNMHPEIAMGKYMDLLSEFIPRWMGDKASSTKKHEGDVDSEGAAVTMTGHTSDPQAFRGNEGSTSIDEGPLASPPNPDKGTCSTLLSVIYFWLLIFSSP